MLPWSVGYIYVRTYKVQTWLCEAVIEGGGGATGAAGGGGAAGTIMHKISVLLHQNYE